MFRGKSKYTEKEKAVDPQFEQARERFMSLIEGSHEITAAANKLKPDVFHGLAEPLASLRVLYQDKVGVPEACDAASATFACALDTYQAHFESTRASLVGYEECLASIRHNIEARDNELLEYHRSQAERVIAAATATGGPSIVDAEERERQHKTAFDMANTQVKKEVDQAYTTRADAFADPYNNIVTMFASLFESLSGAMAPLADAIPSSSSSSSGGVSSSIQQAMQQQNHQVKMEAAANKVAAAAHHTALPSPPQQQHQSKPSNNASGVASNKPSKALPSTTTTSPPPQQHQQPLPSHPFARSAVETSSSTVDPTLAKPPMIPEPTYTADMDEETRALAKKRWEEDKSFAEQKWLLMKRKRDLEDERKREVAARALEDQRMEEEHTRILKELAAKLRQVQETEEQETKARDKRVAEFHRKHEETQKQLQTSKAMELKNKDTTDDFAKQKKRALEDEERVMRFEQWKKDEEERMRRELAARIRAQEEKEVFEREEMKRRRADEDNKVKSERAERDNLVQQTIVTDIKKKVDDFDTEARREAATQQSTHAKERAEVAARQEEVEQKKVRDAEVLRQERSRRDLESMDSIAKVSREAQDVDRQEQKAKARRIQEDIERVERKERERRDQDDAKRRAELDKIRARQAELEALEQAEQEKRDREDREREEMRHRLLSGNSSFSSSSASSFAQTTVVVAAPSSPVVVVEQAKPLPVPHIASPPPPTTTTAHVAVEEPTPAVVTPQSPVASAERSTTPPTPTMSKQLPVPPPKPTNIPEIMAHKPLPKPLPSPGPAAAAASKPSPSATDTPSSSSPATGGGSFDPTTITAEEKTQYATLFTNADKDLDGFINGAEAKPFFAKSKLPFEVLGKIWRMADTDQDNKLNATEFSIAIHLVYACLRGHPLPSTLPASLKH